MTRDAGAMTEYDVTRLAGETATMIYFDGLDVFPGHGFDIDTGVEMHWKVNNRYRWSLITLVNSK